LTDNAGYVWWMGGMTERKYFALLTEKFLFEEKYFLYLADISLHGNICRVKDGTFHRLSLKYLKINYMIKIITITHVAQE
jgi:hypothetical protein